MTLTTLNKEDNKYLNFQIKVNNDDNNVHDRTVNELSKIYYTYLKNNTTIDYDIDDLIDYINKNYKNNSFKKKLLLNYLNFLLLFNDNIINFNCSEYDLILLCWNRVYMNVNSSNKELLKKNILTNIIDFYEDEYDFECSIIVKRLCCTSGRIMKIISSFCHLDYYKGLGEFISRDMLKIEFYGKASKLFNDDITLENYNKLLDNVISEYDDKYKQQLILLKEELIKSLFI